MMALDLRQFVSQRPANAKIHALSWFPSAFNPRPSNEESDLSAHQIADRIAPDDGPRITPDKHSMPYFVPCVLKVAPFVGKTAERNPGLSGKQRSGAHVTESSLFAFDLDDIDWVAQARVVGRLEQVGVYICAFTTWSHGKDPDKVRMRVLLFLDRALDSLQWGAVWGVVNRVFLDGLADPATAKLSQQAGLWAAPAERVSKAFRIVKQGSLLSADALLTQAPQKPAKAPQPVVSRQVSAADQVKRYRVVLWLIGAETYASWVVGLKGLKGAVLTGELSDNDGAALWFEFSDSASDEARAANTEARFDPESLWSNWNPTVAPPGALVGMLMGKARDAAIDRCKADHKARGELSDEGLTAARYLARYHPRAFADLKQNLSARAA